MSDNRRYSGDLWTFALIWNVEMAWGGQPAKPSGLRLDLRDDLVFPDAVVDGFVFRHARVVHRGAGTHRRQ